MDSGTYQERYLERGAELFERLGDNFRLESTLACGAFLRFSRGDYDGVRELTDRIHASGWPDGAPQTQGWGLGMRLCSDLIQGRPGGERIAQLERVLELRVDTAVHLLGRGALSLAYLLGGDEARAREAAEETWRRMQAEPPTSSIGSYGMWAAAWTLLTLWERGDASAKRKAADFCRALRKLGRSARIVRAPAYFFSGRLYALTGKQRRAAHAWRVAIEAGDAFEVPYFTARACSELSRLESVAAGERAAFRDRARLLFQQLDTPEDPFRLDG
jgi:hypothetical protein